MLIVVANLIKNTNYTWKSSNGEFSSGIVIKPTALKIDRFNEKNKSKHSKDNITL